MGRGMRFAMFDTACNSPVHEMKNSSLELMNLWDCALQTSLLSASLTPKSGCFLDLKALYTNPLLLSLLLLLLTVRNVTNTCVWNDKLSFSFRLMDPVFCIVCSVIFFVYTSPCLFSSRLNANCNIAATTDIVIDYWYCRWWWWWWWWWRQRLVGRRLEWRRPLKTRQVSSHFVSACLHSTLHWQKLASKQTTTDDGSTTHWQTWGTSTAVGTNVHGISRSYCSTARWSIVDEQILNSWWTYNWRSCPTKPLHLTAKRRSFRLLLKRTYKAIDASCAATSWLTLTFGSECKAGHSTAISAIT